MKNTSSKAVIAIVTLLFLIVSASGTVSIFFFRYELINFLASRLSELWSVGILVFGSVAVTMLSFCLTLLIWKRLKTAGPSAGNGALFLSCAVVTLLQFFAAVSFMMSASDTLKTFAAVRVMGPAEITLVAPGHLYVRGPIGDAFFADIMAFNSEENPIKVLEIDSEGGMVDQALQLARFIEARKISVIVDDYCMSACILIVVASPEAYAREWTVFGFHRTSPVAEVTSQIFKFGVREFNVESRSFLKSHGVPETILSQADNYGPDEVFEVGAKELVDAGVIKKILDIEKTNITDTQD